MKVSDLPANGKRSAKVQELRSRIIDSALHHFAFYGFEGASMRKIAEDAKTTHSLALYHFGTKDNLWAATMEATVGHYVESVLPSVVRDNSEAASTLLRRFIEQFVRTSAKLPEIHQILTMQSIQHSDKLNWLVKKYLRKHFKFVVDVIRRGQDEGTVRQCDPTRLYYHIIGAAGTHFALAGEFKALTGRDVFSEAEIHHTIAFIFDIVFV